MKLGNFTSQLYSDSEEMYQKCGARTELKPIAFFYILYTFSILLQNGEEIGMKKDRLFLLDETVVPASLTQLREVTSTITIQHRLSFLFLSLLASFLHSLALPLHFSSGAPNGNFRENICSEDDLRTRILEHLL